MPQFLSRLYRELCANEIGLDPTKMTILMMSGGLGVGNIVGMVKELLTLEGNFQLIAMAGRNATLLEDLNSLGVQYPARLFPMGYTTTIERLMAASDFAITKPGGLTSAECLAMQLPMIVVSPIPGQEERNADYLLESGAALKAVDAAAMCYKTQLLLQLPEMINDMRTNMKRVAKPQAAADALRIVIAP